MKLLENAKIVIVRLSALGDVCHAIAVVSAIQARYPQAEITWITGKQEAKLVSMMTNVNVEVYDKKTGVKGMFALRRRFKDQNFDVLLHMQWSLRASMITRMLKAKARIGFSRSHSREKQHWFVNQLAPEPKGPHVLDSLMAIASAIDIDEGKPFWSISIPKKQTSLPSSYIVLNPCASSLERNWTRDGYRQVIAFLLERGERVVLTGGPSDTEVNFVNDVALNLDVINLVGQTSIEELTAIIANADCIVSPDTGPTHIATMVNTPVVGLYAHSNPDRTGPYLGKEQVVSVYAELAEKEYKQSIEMIPWAARVHDVNAMQFIQVEMVLEKLRTVLKS